MRSPSMSIGPAVLAMLSSWLTGCGREPADPSSTPATERSGRHAELDALRALGYADFSAEAVPDAMPGVGAGGHGGYALYTARPFCSAHLTGPNGEEIHRWSHPGRFWADVHLAANGDLLVIGSEAERGESADDRRFLMRLSWDGEVRWKRSLAFHHYIGDAPGGRFLALVYKDRRIEAIDADHDVREDFVVVVSEDGEIVERASVYEMLAANPEVFEFQPKGAVDKGAGRVVVDLTHANALDWMMFEELAGRSPAHATGRVLVTLRHQDAIAVLDWVERRVVWSWGRGDLSGPHGGRWLANGNVLVFDNGLERRASRVVEVDPATNEIVWTYEPQEPQSFFTHTMGASQRLEGGNTLVTVSDHGRAFEVTPNGEVVWELVVPQRSKRGHVAAVPRYEKLPTEFVELLLRSR